jgi:protoporphyrin/coproporphyrin ferrochelatase
VSSPDRSPIGVLVMAHGTPARAAEIEPFYTRIRRGRPPSPEQLAELETRYARIGGLSPLARRTQAQVDGLAAQLEAAAPGRYRVAYGAKHTAPFVEDAARELADAGCRRVVGLVLTPHGSSLGAGEYLARAAGALRAHPKHPAFQPIDHWSDAPGFAELVGARVRNALDELSPSAALRAVVVFTAHSLPQRIVTAGDRYAEELAESAGAAATAAGLSRADWRIAWQSAGRTAEPWIGPALLDVIGDLAAEGATAVVACPIGFVSDHLEVLYDLDVEAALTAERAGIAFARSSSLNDDPAFLSILAAVVQSAARVGV